MTENADTDVGKDECKAEHLLIADGNANLYNQYGNECDGLQRSWKFIDKRI